MPEFRKKPVVIEARQFTRKDALGVRDWCLNSDLLEDKASGEILLVIDTLEGLMRADEGDWIIRGVAGEFYPCKPDIFEATYEPVAVRGADVPTEPAELTHLVSRQGGPVPTICGAEGATAETLQDVTCRHCWALVGHVLRTGTSPTTPEGR